MGVQLGKIDIDRISPKTIEQTYRRPGRAETVLKSSQQFRVMFAGGFTGVGGGGDASSISTKFTMIRLAPVQKGTFNPSFPCYKAWADFSTFVLDIQNFKLESNGDSVDDEPMVLSRSRAYPSIEILKTNGLSGEHRDLIALKVLVHLCVVKYI